MHLLRIAPYLTPTALASARGPLIIKMQALRTAFYELRSQPVLSSIFFPIFSSRTVHPKRMMMLLEKWPLQYKPTFSVKCRPLCIQIEFYAHGFIITDFLVQIIWEYRPTLEKTGHRKGRSNNPQEWWVIETVVYYMRTGKP